MLYLPACAGAGPYFSAVGSTWDVASSVLLLPTLVELAAFRANEVEEKHYYDEAFRETHSFTVPCPAQTGSNRQCLFRASARAGYRL
jgi:hypothetical protein